MKIKTLVVLLLSFLATILYSQTKDSVDIVFVLEYDDEVFELNRFFANTQNDSIQIEALKFYISKLELYQGNQLVFAEENSFHLIDASDSNSLFLRLDKPKEIDFSHIQFQLGIDSLTNMSGAMGGDLDPTKGMYWTWQSGYINFKLEGTSPVCDTRHHFFQFHLGGYAYPNNSCQTIRLETPTDTKRNIQINTDISQFLAPIDLRQQNQIMSLGKESMNLSRQAAQIFSIQ